MGTNKGDNTNNADKEEIISKNRFINRYMVVILMSSEQRARSSELHITSGLYPPSYQLTPPSQILRATSLPLRTKSYELRAYPPELLTFSDPNFCRSQYAQNQEGIFS